MDKDNKLELIDTTFLMNSKNYQDRFIAEYLQLKIRYERLSMIVKKWDKGELDFTPSCPREIYTIQLSAMRKYLTVLEQRAEIEKVDIQGFKNVN